MSSTSMKPAVPAKRGGDGTSIVALMVALMAAIFAFQLNASMLSRTSPRWPTSCAATMPRSV